MANFSGKDGTVTWAGGYTVGIRAFEINAEVDIEEVHNWTTATAWANLLTGTQRWRGTITADFDSVTSIPVLGLSGAATFRAASATQTWSGTIVLESITNAVSDGAAPVEITFTFRGDGVLTLPNGT